jgi:hypothetical protein
MALPFRIYDGGGANSTINEASGNDGFVQRLASNPVALGVAGIVGFMAINR